MAPVHLNNFNMFLTTSPNLIILNVAHNAIAQVKTQGTTLFYSIQIINLSHNSITKLLSYGLIMFPKLLMLILHHNAISMIEANSFYGLDSLVGLDLSHNELTSVLDIPDSSPSLVSLRSGSVFHLLSTSIGTIL